MSVRLADVIAVLDAAYPPHLAHDWDSVGLVCGDPDEPIDSVTVAVDATAAVVETVGPRGLLLAHHPLLLRGVDTVAAGTPKGALIHRLIRDSAALFTAHTNADAANPGVSDALAQVLGLTVDGILDPAAGGPAMEKWVVLVPPDNAEAVRAALFAAGAGRIGDYTHCSWTVTGNGQFLPGAGASPTVGTVGAVEHVAEDRVEVIAPAGKRAAILAAIRAAHSYEEPSCDVFALAPIPDGTGIGRLASLPAPLRLADFVSRVNSALPQTSWGVRAAGDPDAPISRVAVCGGAGDSLLAAARAAGVQAYLTADLRHHPADEHRRGSDVALVDVAHWASEYPWCTQAAGLLRTYFGDALPVTVCPVRTDQRSLLDLTELDAELTRLAHRATHLPEQQRYQELEAQQREIADRLAAVSLAVEDLDAQIAKLESEVDTVRQREDRDRGLMNSGAISDSKQLEELQHELGTLERRQANLEDTLLEVMERREQLAAGQAAEQSAMDAVNGELEVAGQARNAALAEVEQARTETATRRAAMAEGIDGEQLKLYERQRAGSGIGAGRLLGGRCGACRIELDRGELARISAAPEDEVLRCDECGAILLRLKDSGH